MAKETKSSKIEFEKRIRVVERLVLEGYSPKDIHSICSAPREDGGLGWDVKLRQIYNYVAKCY